MPLTLELVEEREGTRGGVYDEYWIRDSEGMLILRIKHHVEYSFDEVPLEIVSEQPAILYARQKPNK